MKQPKLALTWPTEELLKLILGFDEESDDGSEESSDDDEGQENEGEEEEEGEGEGEQNEGEKDDKKEDNESLLKALRDERKLRKTAQKELKALRKAAPKPDAGKKPDDKGGESEGDEKSTAALAEAERKATEAEQRNEKLAAGLATQAVNARVTKFASEMGFRDTDDAIAGVKRADIDFDQDDDDPTQVEVDDETVKQALKDLLKKKPHYKKTAEELRKTGGNVGSGKSGGKDELSDETLAERYPILRRGQTKPAGRR